jgi:LPS-assembly lipoprotein
MKKLAALAFCFPLAACGFHPMYGAGLAPQLATIYVDPIAERDGYELRNSLIDLLGSDGTIRGKRYHLVVNLKETPQAVALQNDNTITRYNETLVANFTLTDLDGKTVTSGSQTNLTAYNVATAPYATLVAQQDADKHAAQDIAESIRLDLAAFFRQHK